MNKLFVSMMLAAAAASAQSVQYSMTPVDPQLPTGVQGVPYTSQFVVLPAGTYTYSVTAGALPPNLSLNSSGALTGTPTATGTFNFTVTGGIPGASLASRAYTLQINPPLVITTTTMPAAQVGVPYTAALAATGGVPPRTWTSGQLPANGLSLNSSTGVISGTPTVAVPVTFSVTAADNITQAVANLAISVAGAPQLTITTTSLPDGAAGRSYTAAFAATGGTGLLTWQFTFTGPVPAGLTFGSNGQVTGTPTAAGTYTVNATVRDSSTAAQQTANATFPLVIRPALSITTPSLPSGAVGQAYNTSLAASGGLSPYTWSFQFSGAAPPGLTFGSNGQITGTPTAAGTYTVNASALDSAAGAAQQTASRSFPLVIAGAALTITTTALPDGIAGRSYSAAFAASASQYPLVWSFTFTGPAPAGLSFGSNGQVSGVPTTPGTYTVNARVVEQLSESSGQTATRTVQLVIRGPLVVLTTTLPTATRTQPYTVQMQASGGTPPYTWGADSNPINSIAPGVTIAPNGVISGTPTTTGTFSPPVFVVDAGTGNASQSLGLEDFQLRVFDPLVITTTSLPPAVAGVQYAVSLGATGGEPGYTWSLAAGSLPAGLTLSPSGFLAGVPATGGNLNLQVRVSDSREGGARQATATFGLNIGAPLSFTAPNPLPPAIVNVPYSFQFTAVGGVAPYTWSILSGTLPPGLTFTPAGLLSGTPQTSGTFSFAVRLRDREVILAASVGPDRTLQGAVDGPNLAQFDQQFTLEVRPQLGIASGSNLGTFEEGQLSVSLVAVGGLPPYSWTLLSGSVQGATLSPQGVLSGFGVVGDYRFSAQVTDRSNQTASRDFTISITQRRLPLEIITPSLPDGNIGRIYAAGLDARGGQRPYSWSVTGLPPGLTADREGSIVGIPQRVSTSTISVQVTDQANVTANATFTLAIRPGAIVIEPSVAPEATVELPYSLQFSAAGGLPRYRFAISGTTPPGLTFAESTLSGTPTEVGTFSFTVEATDEAGQAGRRSYTLVVRPAQLTILTTAAPDAQSGVPYALALGARGGTRPYRWSSTGTLPPGLTLDATSGNIGGTPTTVGTFNFTAQVSDAANGTASRAFTLVVRPRIEITGNLPANGVVGTGIAGSLSATGGVPPYRWSVTGDTPAGTSFADGSLSGTPTTAGAFSFTVQVRDANQTVATRAFSIEIVTPVVVTTQVLPPGTVGGPYTGTIGVQGGRAPQRCSASGLPAGLSISDSCTISGTPTETGSFSVTVTVTDSSQPPQTTSRTIPIQIGVPTIPSVVIGGIAETSPPAQQSNLNITIGAPSPAAIQGTITLTFAPDAVNNADDPAIQFSSGGRSVSFTIPAGSTQASFAAPNVGIQTGTVAGTITMNIGLSSGGTPVTCDCPLTRTIRINRAAPVITSVRVTRNAGGFNVVITGFATSREVTQGVFRFSGTNLQSSDATVNLNPVMTTWFQSDNGRRFGSQFVLTMPFTIQGDANSVNSVSVTLTNAVGNSQAATANF